MVALLVLSLVFLFLLTQLPVLEWGGFATKPVDLFSDIRVDEQDLDLPGDAEWQEEGTEWLNEGVDSLSSVEKDEPQDRQVVLDTIRVQETADTLLVTNISSAPRAKNTYSRTAMWFCSKISRRGKMVCLIFSRP